MFKKSFKREQSEKQYDPRNMEFFPNTELGIDLKLMTREPGRLRVGTYLNGVITHDGEDHYSFVQNFVEKTTTTHRNPHVYVGKFVNVNRKDDGTLYPTFNRPQYTEEFSFKDFCHQAAEELLNVLGLVEEE
jgi:hypothetical protein